MINLNNYEKIVTGTENYIVSIGIENLNVKSINSIILSDSSNVLTLQTEYSPENLFKNVNTANEKGYSIVSDVLYLLVPNTYNYATTTMSISYIRHPFVVETLTDEIDLPDSELEIFMDYVIAEASILQGKLVPEAIRNRIMEYENENT